MTNTMFVYTSVEALQKKYVISVAFEVSEGRCLGSAPDKRKEVRSGMQKFCLRGTVSEKVEQKFSGNVHVTVRLA